jgi:hypothetical protein
MGYIEKRVSSHSILSRIYRTIKPGNSDWIAGALEDMGHAIQAIGYHTSLIQKTTPDTEPVKVVGHRAKLPCDCERVKLIEVYTDIIPSMNIMDAEGKNITPTTTQDRCRKTIRLRKGTDETLQSYGNDDSTRNPGTLIQARANYYNLQGDYIVTGFECGELKIHYSAFPTDNEGLPLIIDDFNYKEAIFYFLLSQMILSGTKINEMTFDKANALFTMHRDVAANNVKMPSVDDMESLVNVMTRYSQQRSFYINFGINREQPEYTN